MVRSWLNVTGAGAHAKRNHDGGKPGTRYAQAGIGVPDGPGSPALPRFYVALKGGLGLPVRHPLSTVTSRRRVRLLGRPHPPSHHEPHFRDGSGSAGGSRKAGGLSKSTASSGAIAAASRRVSGGRFHFCSTSLSTDVWSYTSLVT